MVIINRVIRMIFINMIVSFSRLLITVLLGCEIIKKRILFKFCLPVLYSKPGSTKLSGRPSLLACQI
jgi:hypothetical protein